MYTNLGQVRYLSTLKEADVVLGNSSSGIIEAPFLKTPTVNIGDRQKGRVRAASIIDVPEERGDIVDGINEALSEEFQEISRETNSLYGDGEAAPKIRNVLRSHPLDRILKKEFYDL